MVDWGAQAFRSPLLLDPVPTAFYVEVVVFAQDQGVGVPPHRVIDVFRQKMTHGPRRRDVVWLRIRIEELA